MTDLATMIEAAAVVVVDELRELINAAVASLDTVAKSSEDPVAGDLRRWRNNSLSRVRKGTAPRRFDSDVIPTQLAEGVWSRLAKARSVDEVTKAFEWQAQAGACDECSAYDGQVFADGDEPGIPVHRNCGCELVDVPDAEAE